MSRIIFIAAAFVISIGASMPAFAQARPAASPTPARPAAPQPTPLPTSRPAAPQPTPVVPSRPAAPQIPIAGPANVPTSKIALVDTTAFGDEKAGIRRYVNAVNTVQRAFDGKNAELRNLQSQIKAVADDINKLTGNSVVSPESIRAKQEEGERLQRELKYKKEQADADFGKRYTEVVGPVSNDIGNALIQYASQNGLTMILDISKLIPAVLTVNPAMDVTQAFIADYNSKHP
jgi:Skp family chaperone for outer membrane proteins